MPIVKVGDQRIKFPDGMSQEQIQAALQKQFGQPEAAPAEPEVSTAEAFGRGVRQGGSFGFADEIAAGFGALLETGQTDVPFKQRYESLRDAYRGEEEAAREAAPGAYLGGELIGGLTTGGAGAGRVAGSQAVRNAPRLARMGAYGGVGAAEGALAGAGYSDAEDSAGMAQDAAIGAGFGVAGAAAAPVLTTAGRGIRRLFGGGGDQVAKQKLRELIEATGRSEGEIMAELNRLGPDATLADVDDFLNAQLRGALSTPSPAGTAARQQLEARSETARQRIGEELRGVLDSELDAGDVRAMTASDRIDAAAPMYEEAMETVVDASPTLQRIVKNKAVKSAIKQARDELSMADKPIGAFETLHVAKGYLDDAIGAAKRAGENRKAAFLIKQKKALTAELDNMAESQGLSYREARELYADASSRERALEAGEKMFSGATKPDDVAHLLDDAGLAERQAFLAGAEKAAGEQLAFSSVKDPEKIFNPKNMAKLRQVIPDDESYHRLLDTLQNESRMIRNAKTASGRIALDDGALHGLGALTYGAAGNMNALAAVFMNRVGEALSKMNARQRDAAIKLLTDTGFTADSLNELMRSTNRGALDAATKGITISGAAQTPALYQERN